MNTGKGLISEQVNGYSSCGPGAPLPYLLTPSPRTVTHLLAVVLQDLRGTAAPRAAHSSAEQTLDEDSETGQGWTQDAVRVRLVGLGGCCISVDASRCPCPLVTL